MFSHPLEYSLQSTKSINKIFTLAPAAGPAVVRIGHDIASMEPTSLEDVQDHVKEKLPNLDSRATIEYSLLLASTLTVCIIRLYCAGTNA